MQNLKKKKNNPAKSPGFSPEMFQNALKYGLHWDTAFAKIMINIPKQRLNASRPDVPGACLRACDEVTQSLLCSRSCQQK